METIFNLITKSLVKKIYIYNNATSSKIEYNVINLAESELEFREREFQTKRRERNISENSFLLISNEYIS